MRKSRFEMCVVDGLLQSPIWWKVRPQDIDQAARAARAGQARTIARTPCGHDVWAVAYGPPPAAPGTATWAIGSNSRNVHSYRTSEGNPQVVVLVAGVHAAEAEATAGALDLMALLETGRDLRGTPRPGLVQLLSSYRLVILPCVNMDGRAISPDHLRGASQSDFVRASQGAWLDGRNIGYPDCKEYAPLPLDRVAHPGGYPNGDGYNIMHDCCPGDMRTAEAAGVLKLVADEQADLILHMHSHSIGGQVLGQSLLAYPHHVVHTHAYKQHVFDALAAAGLRPAPVHKLDQRGGIGLAAACAMASGGLSVTFEQSTTAEWSFDEAIETFYVTLETFLRRGLEEPFSPRAIVARGKTE